ncbi:arginine--tRNA ligase [Desulfosarcina ovata]|uniref:Arginine--tRNA ligase n=1 Tax=Desulfosarcina ovata subsp. ovata TaxID=2752305 RepID=A0A5K8ABK5_9BACT|nr:arginine--tRNA ligase [Desulfosarcina ovata]BBO89995.1 arginine--tRNA ligase [Desulfosarcina ovata subsp. ovata]
MKQSLKEMILAAAAAAHAGGILPSAEFCEVVLEEPKADSHGDLSTNMAMQMAKTQRMAPRKIAQALIDHLDDTRGIIARTEIAGPGFINFFIRPSAWHPVLSAIHDQDDQYGRVDLGKGMPIQIEFVSSNPTGPLHVGHGRGAAVGDSTANILRFCGFDVQKEYYINDSGRQIQTLGMSVYLRGRELLGHTVEFPDTCYQGAYIRDLAAELMERDGAALFEKDADEAIMPCARYAAGKITDGMRADLVDFGVTFDCWFSEQSLYDAGKVAADIRHFKDKGLIYEKDGAQWFKTSEFGDEKDRVVVRQNGQTTYFASDITYHKDKFERGFKKVIDVWGADHHGYIPRMKAAVEATGYRRDQFDVLLVQLVNLLRAGQPVAMSTRAGEFVTLADVVKEVGRDAARFIFLTRHYDSSLDFDLELAKQKTNDNPVYYVQYVHARISSIHRKAEADGMDVSGFTAADLAALETAEDVALIKALARYPEAVAMAGSLMEPHRITYYLMTLAAAFHTYYNRHRVLCEDDLKLTRARLYLITAVQKVIRNGLALLGVSAPDSM